MRLFYYLSGFLRLNNKAICEFDFHDYPDSVEQQPLHFYELTCKRCNKGFYI